MPELPDVEGYVTAARRELGGRRIGAVRIVNPFLLRTVEPGVERFAGRVVTGARRLGKRVVLEVEGELFCVIHLMVAGRLRWRASGAKSPGRIVQAGFEFEHGTLYLTEAGKQRRASLHLIEGVDGLAAHDRGGLEPLDCDLAQFAERLRSENRTLKRALCDPRLFSGIGNAYSDEILHAARLSPFQLTSKLDDAGAAELFAATRSTLQTWTERLATQHGGAFPEKVTAFKVGMAAHGRFDEPCPVCSTPIQRIVHKSNETNYCPRCQTDGRILADRALSRLLKDDFPRHVDELE